MPAVYIDTVALAKTYRDELQALDPETEIAVDTEFDTTEHGPKVVLMSYSWARGIRRVVHADYIKFYREILSDPKRRTVYQNVKADAPVLMALDIDVLASFYADTMITSWLHDETLQSQGLKYQMLHYLRWPRQEYKMAFSYVPPGKKQPIMMMPSQVLGELPEDALAIHSAAEWRQKMIDYSGDDAEGTIALHHIHKKYLQEIGYWDTYQKQDREFTRTLMACELRGVRLDLQYLAYVERQLSITIMKCTHVFRAAAGNPSLNLNSAPQMKKLLIEEWGWPTRKDMTTPKGEPKLDAAVYAWWAQEKGYDLAKIKLVYNSARTQHSTFLVGALNGVSPDERLRSDFNQIGANTGRISSRKTEIIKLERYQLANGTERTRTRRVRAGANLQNIPARKEKDPYRIRGAFIAPMVGQITADGIPATEDYQMLVADYSGFELCMAVHWAAKFTPDSPMLQIMKQYKSPSAIHAFTAINLYADATTKLKEPYGTTHKPGDLLALCNITMDDWRVVKKLFPDQYTLAKNNNFNLLYGGSTKMMAILRGLDPRDPDVLAECQEQMEAWNNLYTEIITYQKAMIEHGYKHGWVPTIGGRRANVAYMLESLNEQEREKGERKCMNTPCQGSAADIVKDAMNRIERDTQLAEYGCRLLFPVHDEVVCEVPARTAKQVLARVITLMKKPFRHLMEFELDVEGNVGHSWLEAK